MITWFPVTDTRNKPSFSENRVGEARPAVVDDVWKTWKSAFFRVLRQHYEIEGIFKPL